MTLVPTLHSLSAEQTLALAERLKADAYAKALFEIQAFYAENLPVVEEIHISRTFGEEDLGEVDYFAGSLHDFGELFEHHELIKDRIPVRVLGIVLNNHADEEHAGLKIRFDTPYNEMSQVELLKVYG